MSESKIRGNNLLNKEPDLEKAREILSNAEKGLKPETTIFDWVMTEQRVNWPVVLGILISGLGISFCFYHILTGFFPAPQAHLHRSIHLNAMLILIFLMWPLKRKSWKDRFHPLTMVDVLCIFLVIAIQVWISYDIDEFVLKEGNLTILDQVFVMIYIGLVLEAIRRTLGLALVCVILFFLIHTLYSNYFPGIFFGPPTSFEWLTEMQVVQTYGVLGIPILAMASFVALFIIFAVLLLRSGAAQFFIKLAFALTGGYVGGPAKAAVVSSAMMGSISGSVIGNVVGTGSFTIPLMKQTGYSPEFAAGVEACASTGGMIMPPVMGVTAFVMAEYMGVPYTQVALAAAVPASMYFASIYVQVHLEGKKSGLITLPRELLPDVRETLKEGWHLLIPIAVIVGLLVFGFTISMAAFGGVVSVYFSTLLKKESRMPPLRFFSALEASAKAVAPVSAACAGAGIIIGCLFCSGLSMRFSTLITQVSGDHLWIALILTMIVSMILGMGVTITAVYITLAALVVPSLTSSMNVYPMAAHMFVLYFADKSYITPPVCLASYAAAGVAKADPMRTSIHAFRIGIAGFIVPFMFVYSPELLLHGTASRILWITTTSMAGIICLAIAVEGWLLTEINRWERLLFLLASIALINPGIKTTLLGLCMLVIGIVIQRMKVSRLRKIPAVSETGAAASKRR